MGINGSRLPYVDLEWHLVTRKSSASNELQTGWSASVDLQKLLEQFSPLSLKMLRNINTKTLTEIFVIFNKCNFLTHKSGIFGDICFSEDPIFCWVILPLENGWLVLTACKKKKPTKIYSALIIIVLKLIKLIQCKWLNEQSPFGLRMAYFISHLHF